MNISLELKDIFKTFNCAYEKFDKEILIHGKEVAYITLQICNQLSIDENTKKNLIIAAYLHDVSASKTNYFDKLKNFDTFKHYEHCLYGYSFFDTLIPSSDFSKYILYHHHKYNSKNIINKIEMPLESNILKLADDISLFKHSNNDVTVDKINEFLNKNRELYNPIYLNEILNNNGELILKSLLDNSYIEFIDNYGENYFVSKSIFMEFVECIAFMLDFKCEITNIHSLSVCLFSILLSEEFNFSKEEISEIRIGSLLHDIGKFGIPDDILKKPGRLTTEEFAIMKKHIEYTYEIVSNLKNEKILNIASNHHEKLNGKGYPRAISNLSLAERIVAVADIFAALNQKRSYKKEFPKEKTIEILSNCVKNGELDEEIVNKIIDKYDYFINKSLKLFEEYNNKIEMIRNKYNLLISYYNS